jgi:hypothetical protein
VGLAAALRSRRRRPAVGLLAGPPAGWRHQCKQNSSWKPIEINHLSGRVKIRRRAGPQNSKLPVPLCYRRCVVVAVCRHFEGPRRGRPRAHRPLIMIVIISSRSLELAAVVACYEPPLPAPPGRRRLGEYHPPCESEIKPARTMGRTDRRATFQATTGGPAGASRRLSLSAGGRRRETGEPL